MGLRTPTSIAGEVRSGIEKSRSYPMARHFNLIPHEKDPFFCLCKEVMRAVKSKPMGGNGEPVTQHMTNKRSPVVGLTVSEPYIGWLNDTSADSLPTLRPSSFRYVHNATPDGFVTFDATTSKGKENVKAADITHLLKWLGKFCEASIVDTDEDGKIVGYGFALVIKF
jgi:hypothetical protein